MGVFTTILQIVLAYGSLIAIIAAFVDALRFSKQDFVEVGRMPRIAWLFLLGFCFAMLLWLGGWRPDEPFGPRSFMWFASMAIVALYFIDMRPKLLNARIGRGN